MVGTVAIGGLGRLADLLYDEAGEVAYRLDGSLDANRRPRLALVLRGRLSLRCQRCLGGFAWDLAVDAQLQPVRSGQAIPDDELENDEVDAFEVDEDLDVISLIEEEILLAMPIAPRHDSCEPPRPESVVDEKSPFAVLATLRSSGSKT